MTYHVTIKKEYAEAILADLEKMDAVELSKAGSNVLVNTKAPLAERMLSNMEKLQAISLTADVLS